MAKDNEVKKQNDLNILLNEDSKYAILQRQGGKDSLSWIENFGLHLFEEDCKPHVSFQDGENLILVLRIRKTENPIGINTISAYLCFFKTKDRYTRFCVNAACDEDVEGLKDLMVDKAKWTDESTKNWWKEVFRDLKYPIDEDTLRRKEVLASDSLKVNMMDFIDEIQEIIGKAISKLNVDKQKISKVCVVEQFAMALPLRYAIKRMFPNAQGNVFSFVWKEKKMSWSQNASRFQVPRKFLHTTLLTSPQLSIGDILKLGENGFVITLPLSIDENEKYSLPSAPVIDNSNLKWNDLFPEEILPDYKVGELAFKQCKLLMHADGFQNIYIKDVDENTVISLKKGLVKMLQRKSTNVKHQNVTTILAKPLPQEVTTPESKPKDSKSITIDDRSKEDALDQTPNRKTAQQITQDDTDDSELIKGGDLNGEISNALTLTLGLLRKRAYQFINKNYPNQTVGLLFDKWISSKRINGKGYSDKLVDNWNNMKKTYDWQTYNDPDNPITNTRMLDWGNYYVFIEQNWDELKKEWKGKDNLSTIKDNIKKIKDLIRNDSSHHYVENFQKDQLINMLSMMYIIVEVFKSEAILERISSVRDRVFVLMK